MENNEKSIVSVVAVVVLALFGVFAIFTTVNKIVGSVADSSIGTTLTYNSDNGSYTDGADFKQNVQAIAERFANLSQYQVLQADSQGNLQAVAPSALAGTSWDFDALRASSLVQQGSVAAYTTTSAATAAEMCDSGAFLITPAAEIATVTLPATTTLFADCLTTAGDSISMPIVNGSSVTTTVIAAGSGGTLLVSASTTIGVSDGAILRVVRDTSATYKAMLINAL